MWVDILPLLLDFAVKVLPLLIQWISSLLTKVSTSKKAQEILANAAPKTASAFAKVFPKMLDATIAEMGNVGLIARWQLKHARNHMARPKFLAAAWNELVAKGAIPGARLSAGKETLADAMAEAHDYAATCPPAEELKEESK